MKRTKKERRARQGEGERKRGRRGGREGGRQERHGDKEDICRAWEIGGK